MTDTLDPTPGPYAVHGVMVTDTTETAGGMFCIRPAFDTTAHNGAPARHYGDVIGYAYRLGDAYLMAAGPAMLGVLLQLRSDFVRMRDAAGSDPMRAAWAATKIAAMDEIPVVAEAAVKAAPSVPGLGRLEALHEAVKAGEADVQAREAETGPGNDPVTAQRRANVAKAREILDLLSGMGER